MEGTNIIRGEGDVWGNQVETMWICSQIAIRARCAEIESFTEVREPKIQSCHDITCCG